MTLSQFRDLVQKYGTITGQPYITSDSDWNALINERLAALSDFTLAFDAPKVALTLTNGTATYDYRSGVVASPMSRVSQVYVNGTQLRNQDGELGPYSYNEFFENFPGWMTDTGVPQRFIVLSPSSILLHPTPDSAYTAYVGGQRRHVTLTSDSDVLEIPTQFLRAAARFVWVTANEPWAEGESMQKIARIDQEAAAQLQEMMATASRLRATSERRKSRSGRWGVG